MTADRDQAATLAGRLLEDIAESQPLVQCITNFVSMDISANALLAIGASPLMARAPEESIELAKMIDALVVNTGTLSATAVRAMDVAATAAHSHGKPWLLDPVGAGPLTFRNQAIASLLRHRPSIIRGNGSEIIAVARLMGLTQDTANPRGVDSTSTHLEAEASAIKLARHCLCTVAATGAVDFITDGHASIKIANGSSLMTRVTALGCSLSAVMGGFLGVAKPLDAAIAAIAIYAIAGEIAAARCEGPASFRTAFLDTLYNLKASDIHARLKLA